jgi:hypothetical protein
MDSKGHEIACTGRESISKGRENGFRQRESFRCREVLDKSRESTYAGEAVKILVGPRECLLSP